MNLVRVRDMHKSALQKVLWLLVEQRRTIVMLQGRTRQYKNDTDFVERNKIKHRTGSFTNQRVSSIKVRQNIVIIHWDQRSMGIARDSTLVNGMVPVRGIFPAPAILMELNNQVVRCRLCENMLAHNVDAGWLVGRRNQDSWSRGIETKPSQNRFTGGKPWPEERIELGQPHFVKHGEALSASLAVGVHA